MDSRSKKCRPQIIYNLFDEPYVVVCPACRQEYRSADPEPVWMDNRIEAERVKQECPCCQICEAPFPGNLRGDNR